MNFKRNYKLLILCTAIIAASTTIQAQEGVYDDVSVDFSFTIYTSLVSYGGDSCGSPYIYSTLNGSSAQGTSVYQTIASATDGTGYSWDWSYNQPFYAGGCQMATVSNHWSPGFAITYTQSVNLYSDPSGVCAQQNACTNGTPRCAVASIKEGYNLAVTAVVTQWSGG